LNCKNPRGIRAHSTPIANVQPLLADVSLLGNGRDEDTRGGEQAPAVGGQMAIVPTAPLSHLRVAKAVRPPRGCPPFVLCCLIWCGVYVEVVSQITTRQGGNSQTPSINSAAAATMGSCRPRLT